MKYHFKLYATFVLRLYYTQLKILNSCFVGNSNLPNPTHFSEEYLGI